MSTPCTPGCSGWCLCRVRVRAKVKGRVRVRVGTLHPRLFRVVKASSVQG